MLNRLHLDCSWGVVFLSNSLLIFSNLFNFIFNIRLDLIGAMMILSLVLKISLVMRLSVFLVALNSLASFLVWLVWFLDLSGVNLSELCLRSLSLLLGNHRLAWQGLFLFWSIDLETVKNISLHYKFLVFLIFLNFSNQITLFRFKTNFINDFWLPQFYGPVSFQGDWVRYAKKNKEIKEEEKVFRMECARV